MCVSEQIRGRSTNDWGMCGSVRCGQPNVPVSIPRIARAGVTAIVGGTPRGFTTQVVHVAYKSV